MVSNSRIDVEITARDLLSPVLDRIQGKMRQLDNVWRGTSDQLSGLSGQKGSNGQGLLGDIIFGNLSSQAIVAGVGAVQNAIQGVTSSLMNAAKLQTQAIGTASDVGAKLGVPIQQSRALVDKVNAEIADIAAALPGETRDFNTIFQGIAGTIAGITQGDPEKFQQIAMDITKRAGVLAYKGGADPTNAAAALNRFIAGTMGFNEAVAVQDIFQRNPAFTEALRNTLKQIGKTEEDWKKLGTETRTAVVRNALSIATPDTLLSEYEGTADSIMANIKTNLFDPIKGAFGMLRKVGSMGNRTALDAFTGFLQAFEKLGQDIGKALNKMGISFDPMAVLISVLDWLADVTTSARMLLAGASKINLSGIGDWLAGFMDRMSEMIDRVDWVKVGEALVQIVYAGFEALRDLIMSPNFWGSGFKLAINLISSLMEVVAGGLKAAFEVMIDQINDVAQWIADRILDLGKLMGFGGSSGSKDTGKPSTDMYLFGSGQNPVAPLPQGADFSMGGVSSFTGNVTVNATTGASADDISRSVFDSMNRLYKQEKSGLLK